MDEGDQQWRRLRGGAMAGRGALIILALRSRPRLTKTVPARVHRVPAPPTILCLLLSCVHCLPLYCPPLYNLPSLSQPMRRLRAELSDSLGIGLGRGYLWPHSCRERLRGQ